MKITVFGTAVVVLLALGFGMLMMGASERKKGRDGRIFFVLGGVVLAVAALILLFFTHTP